MQCRTERGREGCLPESYERVPAIVRTLLFYLFKGSEKRGPDETNLPAGSCTGLEKNNAQNLREPHTQDPLSIK